MKIGIDIKQIKEGSYIIIEKQKFFKFIEKFKKSDQYEKIIKFLNIKELEIKE